MARREVPGSGPQRCCRRSTVQVVVVPFVGVVLVVAVMGVAKLVVGAAASVSELLPAGVLGAGMGRRPRVLPRGSRLPLERRKCLQNLVGTRSRGRRNERYVKLEVWGKVAG